MHVHTEHKSNYFVLSSGRQRTPSLMFISQLGSDDLESNVVRIPDAKGKTPSPIALIMCDGVVECALVCMLLLHSSS